MGKVFVKTIIHGKDIVVAVCDEEILGQILQGGRVPFRVSEGFYKGTLGDIDEAIKAIKQGTICNLVGKNIVKAAIDYKIVHERAIIYLGDVPHAQVVKL